MKVSNFKSLFKTIKILIVFLLFATYFLSPTLAHPQPLIVHEFIYRYRPDQVLMDFRLRVDPVVADNVYKIIDKNSDSKLDESELRLYANDYIFPKLISRLNNRDLKYEITGFKEITKTEAKSLDEYVEIRMKAIEPLIQDKNSVYVKYDYKYIPNDAYGDYYSYQDDMYEVTGIERINIENTNPSGTIDYSTDFEFTDIKPTTTSQENPINKSSSNPNQNSNFFTDLQKQSTNLTNQVKNYDFKNPWVFISAFALLFLAGALHALTPGHGKSMVAAFLIGKKKSKLIDVLILGFAITLAHTLIIYIIGFVLLAIKETANAQNMVLFIEKVSAWLFLGLGLILIYNAWRAYQHYSLHNRSLRGNSKVVPHSHEHSWDKEKLNINNRWQLFYAGISGGIVPCFDALSILFVFNSLGRVDLGLILVFIFSLGLAGAIILLGISLLYGKDKFKLEEKIGPRAEYLLPLISGGIIALFGIFYILTK